MMTKTIKWTKAYRVGDSTRYIFCLHDDSIVEMGVFVHNGLTHFCVSTQVGCPVGCLHCATTYSSVQYRRNLDAVELCSMIEYALSQESSYNERILSFSGHGEPLLNWDVVISVKSYFHNVFGRFYITTIGSRDAFQKIAKSKQTDIVYYLSLHGSTDEERAWLMPKAKQFCRVEELIDFAHKYSNQGGKVVLNYMLHKNNSHEACLDRLIQLLNGGNQNVSLRFTEFNRIEYNTDISGLSDVEIEKVISYIELRRTLDMKWCYRYSQLEGKDIGIACGQLRADILNEMDEE